MCSLRELVRFDEVLFLPGPEILDSIEDGTKCIVHKVVISHTSPPTSGNRLAGEAERWFVLDHGSIVGSESGHVNAPGAQRGPGLV